jgi:hypothetical protein
MISHMISHVMFDIISHIISLVISHIIFNVITLLGFDTGVADRELRGDSGNGHRTGEGKGAELVHGKCPQGGEHSGNIQRPFGEHPENIQGTFGEHSANMQGPFGEHSGNIIRGTSFGEHHSGNVIRGTFGEHAGILRETLGEIWCMVRVKLVRPSHC